MEGELFVFWILIFSVHETFCLKMLLHTQKTLLAVGSYANSTEREDSSESVKWIVTGKKL